MLDYMKKRPMLLCAVIGSIICIVGFFSRIAVFCCGLLIIAVFFIMIQKKIKHKYIFIVFILFAVSVSVLITENRIDEAVTADSSTVEGRFIVIEDSENHGNYYSSILEANGCEGLRNGTRIFTFYNNGGFKCGNTLKARIKISSIDETYKIYNYSKGIYLSGNILNASVTDEKGDYILYLIGNIRKYIADTLFANMGYKQAATLTAIVSGDRSYLSDDFYGHIKCAGVSHVMVVSGMHLSVIVILMTYLGERLFYNRYLKALTVVFTVIFMTALCGFTKSILRAGICYIIYAAGIALNRENTPENTLGGAVSLILIAEPFAIFNISFQLSVLSTLGIVACSIPCLKYIKEKKIIENRLLLIIISAVSVTVFALIFTLPVTIYVFGYASTVSIVTNLLISEAVTLALSFAAAALVLNLFLPIIAKPLFVLSDIVVKYIDFVIDEFGSLPFATVTLGKIPFIISLAVLFGVISALFACKKHSDMLKLKKMNSKIVREGGGKLKWR